MERKYGKWSFAQTEAERDPLISNIKHYNDAPPYPINYPVPNFGVDSDVAQTQRHAREAEIKLGKTWKPKRDAKGKWILPHEDVEFKL